VVLLKRFRENPVETRHQVRVEIGWYDEAAAEVFALVVFVSDGLLQVKTQPTDTTTLRARFFGMLDVARLLTIGLQSTIPPPTPPLTPPAPRFFTITSRLPLELQIVMCYRLVGSSREVMPGWHSEEAFKKLANRVG